MPASRVSEEQVLDRLTDVFRQAGYDGASLKQLARAAGLQPASLYHRFPGGKHEMAEAVLQRAGTWLEQHVFRALHEPGEPRGRIERMCKGLREFYVGGTKSCLLDTLSVSGEGDPLRGHIAQGFQGWIGELAEVLREAGFAPKEARRRAEDAVIRVQGALVLARGLGQPGPFERVLRELPDSLLGD